MKRSSRVMASYAIAVVGLTITVYLVWKYDVLATIGKFAWRWVLLVWEPILSLLKMAWQPIVIWIEALARSFAARPFGRAMSWFFAGILLRYLASAAMRARYEVVLVYGRKAVSAIVGFWLRLPLWLKIICILVVTFGVLMFNAGLLLLPLGFFIEPLYRYVRNWFAREKLAEVSYVQRIGHAIYVFVRRMMRRFRWFRALLGPLRWIRLSVLRIVRLWYYRYRHKGGKLRDAIREWREREWDEYRANQRKRDMR